MNTVKRLFCGLLALLLLTGCAAPETPVKRKVALVAKSRESAFFQSVFAGARAAASEYNLQLTISGPDTEEDVDAQNALLAEAVENGADAIVFSAISYDGNARAIEDAISRGIQVVVIDSDVQARDVGARIGTDNVAAGREAAAQALKNPAQKLNVGLVNVDARTRNGQQRERGVRDVLQAEPRVQRMFTINVLTETEDARQQTGQLLREHPEINVLIGFNEQTSVGAALAVQDLGLEGKVTMVGFDNNVRTVDLMLSGAVSALIVQNPYAMGYLGVEAAGALLSGDIWDSDAQKNISTVVVNQENLFTLESQKALFPFH